MTCLQGHCYVSGETFAEHKLLPAVCICKTVSPLVSIFEQKEVLMSQTLKRSRYFFLSGGGGRGEGLGSSDSQIHFTSR